MATSEAEFPLSASNIICRPWVSTGMSTLACFQPVPELVNFRSVASSRLQAFRENNQFSSLLHTNRKEKTRKKNIVLFEQTKMGINEKKIHYSYSLSKLGKYILIPLFSLLKLLQMRYLHNTRRSSSVSLALGWKRTPVYPSAPLSLRYCRCSHSYLLLLLYFLKKVCLKFPNIT